MIIKEESTGGFTDSARDRNTCFRYPNGMARKTKMSAFAIPPKIVPGCKYIVSKKILKPPKSLGEGFDHVKAITAISGPMMTVVLLLIIAKHT